MPQVPDDPRRWPKEPRTGICPQCGSDTEDGYCYQCEYDQAYDDYLAKCDHLYDLYKERGV